MCTSGWQFTSALSWRETKLIMALRFRLQRIKVCIATGMLSTLDDVDDIIPLKQYTLIEQGSPKEDLCMIAFQPQGVSIWEGAEALHLQAEETKL
nr:hypothetical protein [Tanacetum cinerariifolium]GEZ33183.1 hypothetical protein [Tanacetum cinerariifolium]